MSNPTVTISAKCRDLCFAVLYDENGDYVVEGDGYVPDFMPGDHFGDYIMLDIDIVTGQITNWSYPDYQDVSDDISMMT